MILVVGGIASGKRTYLQAQGISLEGAYDAALPEAGDASWEDAAVVLHAEELVRDAELTDEQKSALLQKQAVTCTEVGSGVIPLTWDERQFRERAGALSSLLAQEASCVVRMVCGIPALLKSASEKA